MDGDDEGGPTPTRRRNGASGVRDRRKPGPSFRAGVRVAIAIGLLGPPARGEAATEQPPAEDPSPAAPAPDALPPDAAPPEAPPSGGQPAAEAPMQDDDDDAAGGGDGEDDDEGLDCAPSVLFTRWFREGREDGWAEREPLSLTCRGSPNPEALDRLSLLARPDDQPRPSAEDRQRFRETASPEEAQAFLAPGVRRLHPGLLLRLQALAERFPGHRIIVVSGYRPDARETSRHHHGRALDVRIAGVSREAVSEAARTLPETGVGYYPNSVFTHLDVRDRAAYWVDRSGPGEPPDYGPWPVPGAAPGVDEEGPDRETEALLASVRAELARLLSAGTRDELWDGEAPTDGDGGGGDDDDDLGDDGDDRTAGAPQRELDALLGAITRTLAAGPPRQAVAAGTAHDADAL